MKIIDMQFVGGDLFGLGDDGTVYIYRQARAPFVGREPVPIKSAPCPMPEQSPIVGRKEYLAMMEKQMIASNTPWRRPEACYEEPVALGQILGQPYQVVNQCEVQWQDTYIDGCTAGWEPLSMSISKPVPHPKDPTKAERS